MSEDCHALKDHPFHENKAMTSQYLDFRLRRRLHRRRPSTCLQLSADWLSGLLLSRWDWAVNVLSAAPVYFQVASWLENVTSVPVFVFLSNLEEPLEEHYLVFPLKQSQNLFVGRETETLKNTLNCTIFCLFTWHLMRWKNGLQRLSYHNSQ